MDDSNETYQSNSRKRIPRVVAMTRHSREDVVGDSLFEELYAAADRLEYPNDVEARFILIGCGRLGLRAGELCHVSTDWIDWDQEMLRIPPFDPCTKSAGEPCGYCRKRARSAVECSDNLTMDEALERRWNPKTAAGARAVPYGFSDRVRDVINEFSFEFDEYPKSRATVNRRVDDILDEAGLSRDRVYPHSLRASASTFHSVQGLSTAALQALMGWSSLQTAQKYVRASGGQTQRALEAAHGAD